MVILFFYIIMVVLMKQIKFILDTFKYIVNDMKLMGYLKFQK